VFDYDLSAGFNGIEVSYTYYASETDAMVTDSPFVAMIDYFEVSGLSRNDHDCFA
jgi:hypothetical protein